MKANFHLNAAMQDLQALSDWLNGLFQEKLCCTCRQEFELGLILEELCANIIIHGGENGASTIDIGIEKRQGMLEIEIRDDGPPFDPTEAPGVDTCKPLEEREPGGLGVYLVHHFADAIDYQRENGYNILIIRKKL